MFIELCKKKQRRDIPEIADSSFDVERETSMRATTGHVLTDYLRSKPKSPKNPIIDSRVITFHFALRAPDFQLHHTQHLSLWGQYKPREGKKKLRVKIIQTGNLSFFFHFSFVAAIINM